MGERQQRLFMIKVETPKGLGHRAQSKQSTDKPRATLRVEKPLDQLEATDGAEDFERTALNHEKEDTMLSTTLIRRRRPPTELKSKEEVLRYLQSLAHRLSKQTLSCKDVNRDGVISVATIVRHYGGFSKLLISAGLRASRIYRRDATPMLRDLQQLITKLGRRPSQIEIDLNLPCSHEQYAAEFGSVKKALRTAASYPLSQAVRRAHFPDLSAHGNYEQGKVPRSCVEISLDGSIRIIKRLGIPYVDVICVTNGYGNHFFPKRVGYAVPAEYHEQILQEAHEAKVRRKRKRNPQPHPDILLCTREISRAAHRERDAAQRAYRQGRHENAAKHRKMKEYYYSLKDRGLVHCHARGLLSYVGASPQDLAVYEGAGVCLHSTLHPTGAERPNVEGHPETLFVAAREKARGISTRRIVITLESLPEPDSAAYERTAPPRIERTAGHEPLCWECGESGHIRAECPMLGNDQLDDDYDY